MGHADCGTTYFRTTQSFLQSQNVTQTMDDKNYKYLAFISYSRRDNDDREIGRRWAEWIHSTVQKFATDANAFKAGSVSPNEVFFDQKNIEGDVLNDSLKNALDESRYLIIVCSPHSVASAYVNLELDYFLKRENAREFVIPVVIVGTGPKDWFASNHESLTGLLCADFRLKAEPGKILEGWTDPQHYLAALKKNHHGHPKEQKTWVATFSKHHAEAKTVLLQRVSRLSRTDINDIETGEKGRKWRKIARIGIMLVSVMFTFGMLLIMSERKAQEERKHAEEERVKATKALEVADAERSRAERSERFISSAYENTASLTGDLLAELRKNLGTQADTKLVDDLCSQAIERLGNLASSVDGRDEKYMRAVTLGHMGILAMQAGDLKKSNELFSEAKSIQSALMAEPPRNAKYCHGMSLACDNLGDLHVKIARTRADAESSSIDPEDPDLAEAIREYQQGQTISRDLVATEKFDLRWQDDLSVSHFKLAEALKLAQKFQSAADTLALGLPFAQQAVAADPDDDRMLAHLSGYHMLAGEVALHRGLYKESDTSFSKALEVFTKLSDDNPKVESYRKMIELITQIRKEANPQ
jgi:tetratricopeptide (TPR) repeat protein